MPAQQPFDVVERCLLRIGGLRVLEEVEAGAGRAAAGAAAPAERELGTREVRDRHHQVGDVVEARARRARHRLVADEHRSVDVAVMHVGEPCDPAQHVGGRHALRLQRHAMARLQHRGRDHEVLAGVAPQHVDRIVEGDVVEVDRHLLAQAPLERRVERRVGRGHDQRVAHASDLDVVGEIRGAGPDGEERGGEGDEDERGAAHTVGLLHHGGWLRGRPENRSQRQPSAVCGAPELRCSRWSDRKPSWHKGLSPRRGRLPGWRRRQCCAPPREPWR